MAQNAMKSARPTNTPSESKGFTDEVTGRFIDSYLAYVLARASFLISKQFREMLDKQNISAMQWRILAILSDEPVSVSELARISLRKQPMVSRNVDRMEQAGLLKRNIDIADRRSVRVSLTPKGRRLAHTLRTLAKEHEMAVLAPLGGDNARALMAMLTRLIELHAS